MRLYFDKLHIERFKAYREPATLKLDRMGLGLWYVSGLNEVSRRLGSNGSGKSTIWDAICWVLYGRTVKGHRTPDLINWATGESPDVTVTVATGLDSKAVKVHDIQRTGKANGLKLNGKTVTQERIDDLIGLPFAAFLHSLILGQGKPLFFDLTPTGKMDVLSEAFDLDRWDDRIAAAKKRTDKYERQWLECDVELNAAQKATDDAYDQRDELQKKADAWRLEQDNLKATRADEKLKLEQWLKESQARLGDADLAYDGAETELRASERALDTAKETARPIMAARAKATATFDACSDAERKAQRNRNELVDADNCPACGQRLDRNAIARHREELDKACDEAEDALQEARVAMYAAIDADEAAANLEKGHTQDIRKFRETSNTAVDERTRAQNRCNELRAELNAMNDRLDEGDAQLNPYADLIVAERKKIKDGQRNENELKAELKTIDRKRNNNRYWVEGFKLLRLQLIDDTLAELEAVTQTLLASVGLEEWEVNYAIEKENKSGTTKPGLNVSIYQPEYDQAINWDLFSGGEGQRLRLVGAVALAEVLLRRAGIECDFLVLDEPTRHLSPEGVRDTIDFLFDRARRQQVFYTDHQAVETNRFAGVVKVRRTRAGATLAVH